ncbi:MAG TPA: potassium channel family protein [Aquihabitans sp.]|nr:potassium channel family protein [Aquihabitans sp.]
MPDCPLVDVVAIVVGAVIVAWTLLDSFETLLANNLRTGRLSITAAYYRASWKLTRRVAVRVRSERRRDRLLAHYGPGSFLGLLLVWTGGEILGWGLIWWGVREGFTTPIASLADALYYSGVVYFSIGFGDILPATGGLRLLTVIEGLSGLGTLGLVIGFIPSLASAYSARERQLLLLDDLTDRRITPISLARAYVGPDGDTERLEAFFDEWSAWCAEVYDSHTSYPMLMWWRSKHRGHSWITGLGVVTDAAIAYAGAVEDGDRGAAMRLHRQAVRLVGGLSERVGIRPDPDVTELTREGWAVGHASMVESGFEPLDVDDAYERVLALRRQFHPYMEAFIDELLAPRGFWGVTSAEHLAEAEFVVADPDDGPDVGVTT